MTSLLYFVAAWVAMWFGASLLAPSPELFSPADWRETLIMTVSLVIGMFCGDRD